MLKCTARHWRCGGLPNHYTTTTTTGASRGPWNIDQSYIFRFISPSGSQRGAPRWDRVTPPVPNGIGKQPSYRSMRGEGEGGGTGALQSSVQSGADVNWRRVAISDTFSVCFPVDKRSVRGNPPPLSDRLLPSSSNWVIMTVYALYWRLHAGYRLTSYCVFYFCSTVLPKSSFQSK